MTEQAIGPLTPQGQRTRAALLAGARRVFAQRGYVDTRISDITDAAEVSVGTFYTYFEGKEQIFARVVTAVYDDLLAALRDASEAAASVAPIDRVRALHRRYLEAFRADASLWAAVEEAALSAPDLRSVVWERRGACIAMLAHAVGRWRQEGAVGRGVEPDVAAFGLAAMAEQCAYQWLIFDAPPDPDEAAERLTQVGARILGLSEAVA
jgi:AcrR family transcriptional regulator